MVFLPLIKTSQFLSTPSVRRATPPQSATAPTTMISIHALRAEGDAAGAGT